MWASPCRDHMNLGSSIDLQDAWPAEHPLLDKDPWLHLIDASCRPRGQGLFLWDPQEGARQRARSGPGHAEGQVGAFPAPEKYCAGRKPNTECCTKQKDKVKLQEAILGQNYLARSIREKERNDEGVHTWGCRGTVSLQAGAEAPLMSHCRSHSDQLQQLLQALNGI